jgi:predicted metal-binding membrane protein
MSDGRLESLLRRDRAIVLAALAAVAALAWAYLVGSAGEGGMDMGGPHRAAPGGDILAAALTPWSAGELLLMFVMWTVMMVGMMTPAVAPMLLIYVRVGRQAQARGTPFAAAAWFASGYLLAWIGFAAIATMLQWGLERAALLTPAMASASPALGGLLLIAAGLYQWTPLKDSCLGQCQSPLLFIQRHGGFRGDRAGGIALGLRHGAYCIGCCWALMVLLFLGGVMNLLWIAALAVLVLAEKLGPGGRTISRAAGLAFAGAGVALLAGLI